MALVTYDPDAKALYIKFDESPISKIVKPISVGQGMNLDVAESGN